MFTREVITACCVEIRCGALENGLIIMECSFNNKNSGVMPYKCKYILWANSRFKFSQKQNRQLYEMRYTVMMHHIHSTQRKKREKSPLY